MNFDKLHQFATDHVAGDQDGFREDFCTLTTLTAEQPIGVYLAELDKLLLSYGVDPGFKRELFGIALEVNV